MAESVFNVVRLLRFPQTASERRLGAESIRLFADLLRVVDVAILFAAVGLFSLHFVQPNGVGFGSEYGRNVLVATIFLPFVLEKAGCYKPAALDHLGSLCRTAAIGCAIVFGGLLGVGVATNALSELSRLWTAVWFTATFGGMLATRVVLAGAITRLRAAGHLRETVAIIGAGPS